MPPRGYPPQRLLRLVQGLRRGRSPTCGVGPPGYPTAGGHLKRIQVGTFHFGGQRGIRPEGRNSDLRDAWRAGWDSNSRLPDQRFGPLPLSEQPYRIKSRQPMCESVWRRAKRAPTTCLESRRPPFGGPRLACVVTLRVAWGGRRESNPRDLLGRKKVTPQERPNC